MKASIISIVPFAITREFPGVFPGSYTIPASLDNIPEILHVDDGKEHRYVFDGKGVTIPVSGTELANSFVNDYVASQLAYNEEGHPGIFWVEGFVNQSDLNGRLKQKLNDIKDKQYIWFKRLVTIADDDWQRYHQYKSISDIQRSAARYLNLDRDWIDVISDSLATCPACGSNVRKGFPICANCKAVLDVEAAKKIKFSAVVA